MAIDKYNQLLQQYVNAPYNHLLGIAAGALNRVMPVFNSVAKDGNGATFVVPFICTSLAIDGQFTELEYRFIRDLLGIDQSYDYFKTVVQNYYSIEYVNAIDGLIDSCPQELKGDLLTLCLTFVAVDERISKEENAFIARLLD